MLIDDKTADRWRGAFLGLAVGDALGAAVEFKAPGTFPEVTGFRAGGPHQLEPGEWRADTRMALALGHSIVEVGWDLNDQARRYVSWWRDGVYSVTGRCLDIGGTTAAALGRFRRTGDATTSGDREWRRALAGQDQIEPVLTRLVAWSGALS